VISDFRLGVNEIFSLPGFYAVCW